MKQSFEKLTPARIEARSFEIISEELRQRGISLREDEEPIVKRVIHATADFEYADTLVFSPDAAELGKKAIMDGAGIVTDTRMAMSGVNASLLGKFGGELYNFIADEGIAREAKKRGTTRSAVCMERAARIKKPLIFAIGNAPTALIRLCELIQAGEVCPELVIGVPVGFVNVVYAKERIRKAGVPHIVSGGRKGGSNVAAAVCNALLYAL